MMALESLASGIISFVKARRREGGGFAAAPTLPSSVEDTYFALRILDTLRPVSEDELTALRRDRGIREYLLKMEDRDSWSPRTAFRHLMACRIMGVDPDESWIRRFVSSETKKDDDPSDPYYVKRMLKEGLAEPVPPPGRIAKTDHVARHRTVEELWMALYLAEGNPALILSDRDALISWLHACQNQDGGFGFMPGTTSFMGNNYYSLRCLRILNARPLSEEEVLGFVLRSQGKRGGFARRNGAAPFLDATWHAVATMDLLVTLHRMHEPHSQAGG